MKKRINITIEYEIYNRVRGTIKNISAFCEKCLLNYLENGNLKFKYRKQPKPKAKPSIDQIPQEELDKINEAIKIANYKWINN